MPILVISIVIIPESKFNIIWNRLVEAKTNFVESLNGIQPIWKSRYRFEPKMEALNEAMNELQMTSDAIQGILREKKPLKRNSDGVQVNKSEYIFFIALCLFPFPIRIG